MSEPTLIIGVDVGGTKIAAGLLRLPQGEVLARRIAPTQPLRGGEAILRDLIDIVKSLCGEPAAANLPPRAIGVGVAELVDPHGQIVSSATIPWQGWDLAARLQSAVALPARIEADVRAAAWGEATLGAGRGLSSFLYVTVGTGISSCLVLDGRPLVGARGLTGTLASSRDLIPADDGTLACGPPLEGFSSGPAVRARFAALRAGFSGTTADVLSLATQGDALAQEVARTAGRALGAAVARLVNTLDPEAVVLGGGLGLAEGMYRDSFDAALREHVWADAHRDVPVLSAALGVDAGWIGAAIAAAQNSNR